MPATFFCLYGFDTPQTSRNETDGGAAGVMRFMSGWNGSRLMKLKPSIANPGKPGAKNFCDADSPALEGRA
jgi:hypothetical protein